MSYSTLFPNLSNIRGTHYEQDSGFLYFVSGGRICRAPTAAVNLIATRTNQLVTPGVMAGVNLNGLSPNDIKVPTMSKIEGWGLAKPVFISIPETFPTQDILDPGTMNWAAAPDNVTSGDEFVTEGHYAVKYAWPAGAFNDVHGDDVYHISRIRVTKAAPSKLAIDYATYMAGNSPHYLTGSYGDVRDIVVTNYESRILMTYVEDGTGYIGYVERNSGADPYPSYGVLNPLNEDSLTSPQQIAADGANFYVVDHDGVWRVSPDDSVVKVITGINDGVGLLIRQEGSIQVAYIAEASGDIRVVYDLLQFDELPNTPLEAPQLPLHSLDTTLGFMSWANEEKTAFLVTDRDNNKVIRVDLLTGMASDEMTLDSAVPWCVEPGPSDKFYVASETEIGVYTRTMAMIDGVVAMGIGLIPFDYINNSDMAEPSIDPTHGMADTSSVPGYYFWKTPNLAFGGTLSLMINHELAWNIGARSYSMSLENLGTSAIRTVTNSFVDLFWDANPVDLGAPRFEPRNTSSVNGRFPVRDPDALWYNHFLAAKIDTDVSDNGHNILTIQLYDANNKAIADGRFERLLLVDNTRYSTVLRMPRLGTSNLAPEDGDYPTLECGCLLYQSKDDLVEFDFAAWHPEGLGEYKFWVSGGSGTLNQTAAVAFSNVLVTKKTTTADPPAPIRVGHVIGDCDIAGVNIGISTHAYVIDGYKWIDLGSNRSIGFTLAPASAMNHTPWQQP